MQNKLVSFYIGYQTSQYTVAHEIFAPPFNWLKEILQNMSGYTYPSGYAIIHSSHIIQQIWVGDRNEYPLCKELRSLSHEKIIFIDSYNGPEGGNWGWRNLNKTDLEKTFSFIIKDDDLEKIDGFPNNLNLIS